MPVDLYKPPTIDRIFTIAEDEPVPVVEDKPERQDWFASRLQLVVIVARASDAIGELQQNDYAWIFLDHDLEEGTGADVARYLVAEGFHGCVVVHSVNYIGAQVIAKILRTIGIRTALCEFGRFDLANRTD